MCEIHLLRMRAINVSALSTLLMSGSFYSDNADTIFWIGSGFSQSRSDPASVNLDPIRIEFNPDYSASADTPTDREIWI